MKKLFSQLFKKSPAKAEPKSTEPLKEEYNTMSNITLVAPAKFQDTKQYTFIEKGIYEDLNNEDDFARYRMAIAYNLEADNDGQYPLDDILTDFKLYVSDFLEPEGKPVPNRYIRELAGDLEDLLNAQIIIGKKVFNRDFLDDDGEVRVKLVIE